MPPILGTTAVHDRDDLDLPFSQLIDDPVVFDDQLSEGVERTESRFLPVRTDSLNSDLDDTGPDGLDSE